MPATFTCTCGHTLAAHNNDHHGPTIGICGHTGADWDTLLTVLTDSGFPWNVIVYLVDGTFAEGNVHYENSGVIKLTPNGEDDNADPIYIDMENVLHIQIG